MVEVEPPRQPVDDQDRYLLRVGWTFAGLALFQYPHNEIRGAYTKAQAIALTEEMGLDLYCPLCGACGEEGCCSPDRCGCLHREHYDKTYETLLKENARMYTFIQEVEITREVELDELPVLAAQLLEEL